MLCFRHTSHIRTQSSFIYIRKSQFLQCCLEHLRRYLGTELSGKCRCYLGYDLPSGLHGTDQLENLGLIGNGTEGTAYHTLTAGYTFLIVDHGSSHMVRCNSSNTAGSLTGTLFVTNRIIRADFTTFSALDTFFLINDRFPVLHGNRTLGADTLAGMCQTSHAGTGHLVTVLRAGIACRRNDLHQRGFIIFLINIALFQSLCQMSGMLTVLRAQAHTHGQTDALTDDRSVTINALPELRLFIVYDLIRQRLHIIFQIRGIVSQISHFLKYSSSPLSYRSIDPSHAAHITLPPFDIFLTH